MAADMAVELKKQNVACVSLWPGAVMTEHVNDFLSQPQDEIVIFWNWYFLPLPPPCSLPQLHLHNSEEKFDVRKIQICDIIGWHIQKEQDKKGPFTKNQLLSVNWRVDIRTFTVCRLRTNPSESDLDRIVYDPGLI